MKKMNRRGFLQQMVIGGTLISFGGVVFPKPTTAEDGEKVDIGLCKGLTITCISEVGWWDTQQLFADLGSGSYQQWNAEYDPDNAAGVCSLIDIETLDGTHDKILLDTGWNTEYMDMRFDETGIGEMLRKGEIEHLFISHEHLDHLWGLESVLKHKPDINIFVPSTFGEKAFQLIGSAEFKRAGVRNKIEHTGKLVKLSPGGIHKLLPGCASATFNTSCGLGAEGEHSLYFNVKDKGIVCVAGCCHQSILALADLAQKKIVGGDKMHGVYGGLHIAPFDPSLDPEQENIIKGMAKYNFQKLACNHCTGFAAVEKMVELGYPVVRGTGRFGSKSVLYIGNGDKIIFG